VLEEEATEPPTWSRNAKLGRFTNFVNLLDMCGIAIPAGLVSYDAAVLSEVGAVLVLTRAALLCRRVWCVVVWRAPDAATQAESLSS
jgi:allophanate hydrolase